MWDEISHAEREKVNEMISHPELVDFSGWLCIATGKTVTFVWTKHDRPGVKNACLFCTGKDESPASLLMAVQNKRKGARRAK